MNFLQRIHDSDEMYKGVTLQNETLSIAFKVIERKWSIDWNLFTSSSSRNKSLRLNQNTNEQYEFLKDQLQISEEEIERLKTFEQTKLDNERITSISDDSQMGIKNHSLRDNILACSDPERQPEEEVNIHLLWFFWYILLSTVNLHVLGQFNLHFCSCPLSNQNTFKRYSDALEILLLFLLTWTSEIDRLSNLF